jgi:putative DNA primase/helicase
LATSILLRAAVKYAEMGWYVIPDKSGDKIPLLKEWQNNASNDPAIVRSWWDVTSYGPDCNIGLNCGMSGLVVIDLDNKNGRNGFDSWQRLIKKLSLDSSEFNTMTSHTPSGGYHLFFAAPKDIDIGNSQDKLGPGIEVKGIGGKVTLPPSIHPNGKTYEWDATLRPSLMLKPKPLPQKIIDLLVKNEPLSSNKTGERIPKGQRDNAMTKLAGLMRGKAMEEDAIFAALIIENNNKCDPPLSETDIKRIAHSIGTKPPNEKSKIVCQTDVTNSERFVETYHDQLKYCYGLEHWKSWNGQYWREDIENQIRISAIQLVKDMVDECEDNSSNRKRAITYQHHARIMAMIDLAKHQLPSLPTDYDSHSMLLNCKNGIIDLTNGELKSHDPNLLLSKIIPVAYDKNAECKLWEKFMSEIMVGNDELISFMQRLIGYSLTGEMSEQYFYILYGTGDNGKTTCVETIMSMMGDYGITTPPEGIMVKRNGNSIPNEMARLPGIRLTSVSETDEGQRLSEGLIKSFTGGETIEARQLYGQLFSFKPIAKIWIQTNHKPTIRGRDHAIWRRVVLIPFDYLVDPILKDLNLKEKLKLELPGILNWALQGCREWQRIGLNPPTKVTNAVEEYRVESDVLGEFIDSEFIVDVNGKVNNSEIRQHYVEWCKTNNEEIRSSTWLGKMLGERFGRCIMGHGSSRGYRGLRVKAMEEQLNLKDDNLPF